MNEIQQEFYMSSLLNDTKNDELKTNINDKPLETVDSIELVEEIDVIETNNNIDNCEKLELNAGTQRNNDDKYSGKIEKDIDNLNNDLQCDLESNDNTNIDEHYDDDMEINNIFKITNKKKNVIKNNNEITLNNDITLNNNENTSNDENILKNENTSNNENTLNNQDIFNDDEIITMMDRIKNKKNIFEDLNVE